MSIQFIATEEVSTDGINQGATSFQKASTDCLLRAGRSMIAASGRDVMNFRDRVRDAINGMSNCLSIRMHRTALDALAVLELQTCCGIAAHTLSHAIRSNRQFGSNHPKPTYKRIYNQLVCLP